MTGHFTSYETRTDHELATEVSRNLAWASAPRLTGARRSWRSIASVIRYTTRWVNTCVCDGSRWAQTQASLPSP
jgi:hypothetical protein